MKTIFLICFVTLGFSSLAQRGKQNTPVSNPNQQLIELNQTVYKGALAINDSYTAIYAAHMLIALNQETYRDSLALLYLISKSPAQTITILKPLLKTEEKDARIDLMWRAQYALNDFANALIWLEKLPKTAEIYAIIAECQFKLKREGEFEITLNKFLNESDELKNTRIFVPGEVQAIKAKSYLGHLLAFSMALKEKTKEALDIYIDILKDDSDFSAAKDNVQALQEMINTK